MSKKFVLVFVVVLGAVLLSACAGGPVHGSTWPGLAADGDTAYLADGPFLYAINVSDGKEVWRYPGQGTADADFAFYSTPAITPDGLVIVGSASTNDTLVALDTNRIGNNNAPAEAWRFTGARDHWRAAPLVVDDKLFAVNSDGNLYVLNLQDGRLLKELNLDGRLWAQPTTDGERVYVTSLDHSVIAIDANTYEVLWHEDLGGAVPGSAVSDGDALYVGSLASRLEKFNPATGSHETIVEAENWVWSTPTLDGDTLYFSDVDGNFYSVDTATGNVNWTVKPDGPITASPLIQDEYIFLATESGSVYAVDREGKVLWSEAVGGKIYTTPVAAGDVILVAPLETEFYLAALDKNGRQVWPYTPGE